MEIVKGEEFSREAFELAMRSYFSTVSDKVLKDYLVEKHIAIRNTDRQWFNDAENKDVMDYWESYQQELFSKIHLRWTYLGSIDF